MAERDARGTLSPKFGGSGFGSGEIDVSTGSARTEGCDVRPEPSAPTTTISPPPKPVRHWTPAAKASFLSALARCGNVRHAARFVSMSRESAYQLRRRDADFAAAWQAALLLAVQEAEDVLQDKALHGWEEEVFFHGEEVGRRTRFDGRLLLALLGRLDRRGESALARRGAAHFDELVAAIGADEPLGDMLEQPDPVELAHAAAEARAEAELTAAREAAVAEQQALAAARLAEREARDAVTAQLAARAARSDEPVFYRITAVDQDGDTVADRGAAENRPADYAIMDADLAGVMLPQWRAEPVAADDAALIDHVLRRGQESLYCDMERLDRWLGEEPVAGANDFPRDSVNMCEADTGAVAAM